MTQKSEWKLRLGCIHEKLTTVPGVTFLKDFTNEEMRRDLLPNLVLLIFPLKFKSFQRETLPPRLWKGNSWTPKWPTGTAPSTREDHTVVSNAAGDGFFVFGGYSGTSSSLGQFGCFVWQLKRNERGHWPPRPL